MPRIRAAFVRVSGSLGAEAFTAADHVLTGYAKRWTGMQTEACRATRVLGMVHGLAFVAYEMQVLNALATKRWPNRSVALGALAGFLPFGTFYFVAHLRRVEASSAA